MQIVSYKDLGSVSSTIRCQYAKCRNHPFLRHVFFSNDKKTIGRICAKKIGGNIKELKPRKRKSSTHRRKKHEINPNQLTLIEVFKRMEENNVTPRKIQT